MIRCVLDESISRRSIGAFEFPLGVYPVEPMSPREGYTKEYEAADPADAETEIEPWPDRYVYDVVVSAPRVEALWFQLFSLMPGRVYPILDYIGHDAHREIDPYIAYEPTGMERVISIVRRCSDFLFEDGMVGFGAVSDVPFYYLFVDEHKILTVRAEPEMCHRVERILKAFGLTQIEDPAGADASAHEHRSVLSMPQGEPNVLGPDEAVDLARESWGLILNVDPETNLDDDGKDLGITAWRCILRSEPDDLSQTRYAEIFCSASCLRECEDLALAALDQMIQVNEHDDSSMEMMLLRADRVLPESMEIQAKGSRGGKMLPSKYLKEPMVLATRWIDHENAP